MEENQLMPRIAAFLKKNFVMAAAFSAAVITGFFVPPDRSYLGYFDLKTLTCLFCTIAVVCALRNVGFFYMLACRIIVRFKNMRLCILALVYITFLGSMLMANDMALLTFLPLGYFVLTAAEQEKYMAFTFIMQNIAANLGGMLTPFGNPQNLYLYSYFSIPNGTFLSVMAPPFAISVVLITACCLFVKPEKVKFDGKIEKSPRITIFYLLLFALAISVVFRAVPYYIGLIVITAALLITDRKALREVDYPLLMTFVFFFVFAGNMARIPAVRSFFSALMEKNTLLFSALSCQIISNVPSAILLSRFTADFRGLLVGVNIGGVGTLIASLASLITFREYARHNPGKTGYYIRLFSAFNFGFLGILLLCMTLLGR